MLKHTTRRGPAPLLSGLALAVALAGCSDDSGTNPPPEPPGFLDGTENDPQIGLVVASLERAVHLFQLGDPTERRAIALGTSSSITPLTLRVRGDLALVPLGDAASVALVDLRTEAIERFFLFPEGNTSGAAFVDDRTALATNLTAGQVGRFSLDQAGDAIAQVVDVTPQPYDVQVAGGRALVVSANLDENYAPLGNSVVTALDPATLQVLGTVDTGGQNAQWSALGPDGLLYVVNTGNFFDPGSMAVIDPSTLERVRVVENMGVGPGAITIDDEGLAYVSGFFFGTLVYDTGSGAFVRGPDNPVCAPVVGGCRGAFHGRAAANGDLYQAFFGSPGEGLPAYTFVYQAGSFALTDSIATGEGPAYVGIEVFGN